MTLTAKNTKASALTIFALALGVMSLGVGAVDASAKARKPHIVVVNSYNHHPKYEVLSYSVPKSGPYSGYQFYEGFYPTYLNNIPDTTFGCCGQTQKVKEQDGSGTSSGAVINSSFGWQQDHN